MINEKSKGGYFMKTRLRNFYDAVRPKVRLALNTFCFAIIIMFSISVITYGIDIGKFLVYAVQDPTITGFSLAMTSFFLGQVFRKP